MKIDNGNVSLGLNGTNGVTGASQNHPTSRTHTISRSGEDGTSLGSFSSLVALTMAGGGDRVSELRQLVKSGEYQVDSKALSRSIVDSALNGD